MEQPYLQQVSVQAVHDLLLQHNNKLFSLVSELMDFLLTGEDQSQVDQPNSLAGGKAYVMPMVTSKGFNLKGFQGKKASVKAFDY
eukprot:770214-Pelagomonas_calceolata.AAC.1